MSSSSNATITTKETSISTSGNKRTRGTHTQISQRRRHVDHPKYKGVFKQQSQNWGSQIYFNYERIWLGTFESETEAGMAYDSAALKLRNRGRNDRNFPWTDVTTHELSFQSLFTTEAVISMIRDGSYPSRLAMYLHLQNGPAHEMQLVNGGHFRKILFQKELTPSDVGRLNRLVIPKKDALEFFPLGENGRNAEISKLTFFDTDNRMWIFKYSYWKSSRTFVLSRGWKKFVSVHNLKTHDVISFLVCQQGGDPINGDSAVNVIEVAYRNPVGVVDHDVGEVLDEVHGGVMVGPAESIGIGFSAVGGGNENLIKEDENESVARKKGFRLFGVQII